MYLRRFLDLGNIVIKIFYFLAFSNEHSQHLLVDDQHKAGDERAKHFEDMLKKSISSSSTINPNEINLKSNSIDFIYIHFYHMNHYV
jgi:hypothetical protein